MFYNKLSLLKWYRAWRAKRDLARRARDMAIYNKKEALRQLERDLEDRRRQIEWDRKRWYKITITFMDGVETTRRVRCDNSHEADYDFRKYDLKGAFQLGDVMYPGGSVLKYTVEEEKTK